MNRVRDSRVLRSCFRFRRFRFVSFGVCRRRQTREDPSAETGSSLRPYLRRGPRFRKAGPKSEGLTPKPIGLSRNSNRTAIMTAIRYSGDLPAVRRAPRARTAEAKTRTANDIDVSGTVASTVTNHNQCAGPGAEKGRALGPPRMKRDGTERADGTVADDHVTCEGDATHHHPTRPLRHAPNTHTVTSWRLIMIHVVTSPNDMLLAQDSTAHIKNACLIT